MSSHHPLKAPDFWPFSLDVYRREGVEAACLQLQDQTGLDVNCVLFCCWAAAAGFGRLTDLELQAMQDVSASWNAQVVMPLRGVRRVLKDMAGPAPEGPVASLRQSVKDLELEAEWYEQRLLGEFLTREPNKPSDRAAAQENLRAYLALCGSPATDQTQACLDAVLDAAFSVPSGRDLH